MQNKRNNQSANRGTAVSDPQQVTQLKESTVEVEESQQVSLTPLTPIEQFLMDTFGTTDPNAMNDNIKSIVVRLDKYVKEMAPNSVRTVPEGCQSQKILISCIRRALAQEGDNLFKAVDLILFYINHYREACFSDRLAFRFLNLIPDADIIDRSVYATLVEIFVQLSNPTNRPSVARNNRMRAGLRSIDPKYRNEVAGLITYLSQYHQ